MKKTLKIATEHPLGRIDTWLNAPLAQRTSMTRNALTWLPTGFALTEGYANGKKPLPQAYHEATDTTWVLIPHCTFRMGLSVGEERAARTIEDPPPLNIEEMRPDHETEVPPFLIMSTPVDVGLAGKHLGSLGKPLRPVFAGRGERRPVYLTRSEVEQMASTLGVSLPSETQWECACRGGTSTLFFFGNKLPGRRRLERFVTTDLEVAAPNPFGLFSMFLGEWCADRWRPDYASEGASGSFVVRGGGAAFWPWQGSEWGFCVSAMRMPSEDLANGLCGARFAVPLKQTTDC